jgi:hypothetical protein
VDSFDKKLERTIVVSLEHNGSWNAGHSLIILEKSNMEGLQNSVSSLTELSPQGDGRKSCSYMSTPLPMKPSNDEDEFTKWMQKEGFISVTGTLS